MPKNLLTLEALSLLVEHDVFMRARSFSDLCKRIRETPCRQLPSTRPYISSETVSVAVDIASALYFKPVLCLQRSAVLCSMLRRRGLPARFVVGVQQSPFQAHAWIELDGRILRDSFAEQQMFQVLENC